MKISITSTRIGIRTQMHYTHVDSLKTLEFILTEEKVSEGCLISSPYDLTGLTSEVCFKRLSDNVHLTRSLAITDAVNGLVQYTFVVADYTTDFTPGDYHLSIKILNGSDIVCEDEANCCPAFEVREKC